MLMHIKKKQKGFTLIEVLVVIGILAILLAITLIALNPAQHFAESRNTQRSSNVSAILNAISEYQAANKGNLPPTIAALTADTVTPIRKSAVATPPEVNPCTDIVPTYLADLPIDPGTTGTKDPANSTVCAATTFTSGYTITRTASNRVTVTAPAAENGATISVTR